MSRWLKRIGWAFLVVLTVAAATIGSLYLLGGRRFAARHDVEIGALAIPSGPEAREHGRHLARVHCANCHGMELEGAMFIDGGPFATIVASNLTSGRGGVARRYDADAWVRAIRHGVNADGRALMIMPADVYRNLGEADLGALVAYLLDGDPVDGEHPTSRLGPIGRLLLATGKLRDAFPYYRIDHAAPPPAAPGPGPTAQYGEYWVRSFGCSHCHGEAFAGGVAAGTQDVWSPNLTPGGALAQWDEALFLRSVAERESEHMPWRTLRRMSDIELRATWAYLVSLPARASAPSPASAGS